LEILAYGVHNKYRERGGIYQAGRGVRPATRSRPSWRAPEYNKEKFPGLVYRVKAPRAAFLIFTSGKVVCTGAKNVEDVRTVITNMAKTLKSIGFEKIDLEPEIHVQNIVASADLKTDLNLNAIALGLGLENIEYEPEQFPGLVYRIKQPKVVVLIFSSGKLVVTGGKSPEECEEGVHIVRQQLENMGLL